MNHITECLIVGGIYFLIIRCRFVPSERAVLHIQTGKGCLFYLNPDNFALKVCLQNHFGCLADQQKHALKSARRLSLLFNSLAIQRAAGSAPWRAQQPSASSWPMIKAIWELVISITFKLFISIQLCASTPCQAKMPLFIKIIHLFHTSHLISCSCQSRTVERNSYGHISLTHPHVSIRTRWNSRRGGDTFKSVRWDAQLVENDLCLQGWK